MAVLPTPSQTVGPFFAIGLPYAGGGEIVPPGTPGARRWEGRVFDGAGEPVPDALLEVWQSVSPSPSPSLRPGDAGRPGVIFGRCATDPGGRFAFVVPVPAAWTDERGRRHAPSLDVIVFARGLLRQVVTRLYFPDEAEANAHDPVLAAVPARLRDSLVARDDGGVLRLDVRLQGGGQDGDETVFFAF
jgi:protocatechuate 3,4-dioxygenase alpha subunit